MEKLGIRGIQDSRQFAFGWTNEVGQEAQLLDKNQQNGICYRKLDKGQPKPMQ